DILLAGDAIILTSDRDEDTINGYVPVNPRDPNQIRYDGGDRIVTSGGPVDLAHAMWPLNNSWIGGAWEVYSRQAYAGAYSYRLPIGRDLYHELDSSAYGDFEHVYLQLEAFEDNTTISIDNGAETVNLTIDRGQTYSSMGYLNSASAPAIAINSGTTIRSSKPTQVGLVTGADSGLSGFQGRFLIVLPDKQWGADYVVPVPSGDAGDEAEVYLSNPNDFPITIQAYDVETQATFAVSPTGYVSATVPYSRQRGGLGYVPRDSAARFTSSDGVFGVVVCADTANATYDWGFSAIPSKYLTRDYYIPWAPGATDLSSNGSPVWVTPLTDDTTFCVDYSPLDGVVDETFTLDVLEQRRIFDPDNDNTGMHVWASGEFAVAWGEDPRTADSSDPYLDLGLTTLPLQQRWLDTVLTLDKTAQPTILPPEGGSVTFTLLSKAHNAPLVNVDVTDTLPLSWTYVPHSTHVTYPNGSTENPEPEVDGQVLFWDLSTALDLGQSLTLTFQAQITNTTGVSVSVNRGQAIGEHQYSDALFNPTAEATVHVGPLNLIKSVSHARAGIGDTLVYTLSYANHSHSVTATNVVLRDVVPVQHVTFQSASHGGTYKPSSGTITWSLGTLNPGPGISGSVSFTVTVNDFVADGTVIENVGYIRSDQMLEASSNRVRTAVSAPDVEFTKSGPTVAEQGQVITYTISYENVGLARATGVRVWDTIPVSTTYVTGSLAINPEGSGWVPLSDAGGDDQGAYVSPTLVITPGALEAGEGGQIRFSVRLPSDAPGGSLIQNWANLDRDLDTPRESNLVVTRISDLLIAKAAGTAVSPVGPQATVAAGGLITYRLTYENVLTHTNVYVREPIPDYTRLITATGVVSYSWDNGATWSATRPATQVTHIRWHDALLPPGSRREVGFTVRVSSTLPPGTTIHNMAHISSTQTGEYLSEWIPSNQVQVATVDLWVEKDVAPPNPQAGGPVSYTISYGNRGSADALGVQIVDTVPTGTTYVPGSIWGTGADDGREPDLVWELGTVPARSSARMVG
ncbi:MAG: hypothetical protein DRI48_08985, partial [Chloroflexi bacterium]